MKTFKKIFAIVLALAVCGSVLCGCTFHEKNETVVTVGETQIGSELYIMYMYQAYNDFKAEVDKKYDKNATDKPSTDEDYFKQKVDDKDSNTWMNDKALDYCKNFAWTEKAFKDLGITLTDEQNKSIDQYQQYIMYYNASLFEANGISADAVKLFCTQSVKQQAIFEYYYGKDGKNAVTEDEIMKYLTENYVEVSVVSISTADNEGNALSNEEIAKYEEIANDFAAKIQAGEMTFAEADKQLNGPANDANAETENDKETEEKAEDAETEASTETAETEKKADEEKKIESKFESVKVYTSNDSDTTLYDTYKKITEGDGFEYDRVAVQKLEKEIVIYAIRNIENDKEYILDTYDMTVRHSLKDDEFKEKMNTEKDALTVDAKSSLVKRYKATELTIPQQ